MCRATADRAGLPQHLQKPSAMSELGLFQSMSHQKPARCTMLQQNADQLPHPHGKLVAGSRVPQHMLPPPHLSAAPLRKGVAVGLEEPRSPLCIWAQRGQLRREGSQLQAHCARVQLGRRQLPVQELGCLLLEAGKGLWRQAASHLLNQGLQRVHPEMPGMVAMDSSVPMKEVYDGKRANQHRPFYVLHQKQNRGSERCCILAIRESRACSKKCLAWQQECLAC